MPEAGYRSILIVQIGVLRSNALTVGKQHRERRRRALPHWCGPWGRSRWTARIRFCRYAV